nr:hypothetical protein [Tanacetum cinerariifolium]
MFFLHLLTIIVGRKWLLTHGMELAVAKSLNSPEYLSALGIAVSKAIEKGMQDGLAAGITHGKEGLVLTDVATHNPSADVVYVSALQQLQGFHSDQLTVPIHHSPNTTVVGASALSFALDVFDAWVQRIKENIMSHRSLFRDVFILLDKPFSAAAITSTKGTSNTVLATADTIADLSVTFASASNVDPISIDDYEVTGTDDQPAAIKNVADTNVKPFPNVDDAKLNIS